MKYVAYVRVSTNKQDNGLQAQMMDINRFITDGDEIIALFEEKESGGKADRLQLKNAIQFAQQNDATLLVAKLDRLSRSVSFISQLMESDVKFRICNMPSANRLTIHVLAAVAEEERLQISKRTKAGLSVIKRNIETNGYHISKQGNKIKSLGKNNMTDEIRLKALEAISIKKANNENLIKAKALAKSLMDGGMDNLSKIAEVLNTNGFKTSRGGKFQAVQVKRLF